MKVKDQRNRSGARSWAAIPIASTAFDQHGVLFFKAKLGFGVVLEDGEHFTAHAMHQKGPFFCANSEVTATD